MNFNQGNTNNNEYMLFRSQTEELINLYGVPVTYINVVKENQDKVFGEHSHIKTTDTHELYMLPEDPQGWEGDGGLFSSFGLENLDSVTLFVSRNDMEKIHPALTDNESGELQVNDIPNGSLCVFESDRIMEVTSFKLHAEGANNIYTSKLGKNVYKLVMTTYMPNGDNVSSVDDVQEDYESFGDLDKIFGKIAEDKVEQEHIAEERIMEDEVVYPAPVRKKPIRAKVNEISTLGVFGDLD